MLDLTILVPAYNEQECLLQFQSEMDRFLAATPLPTTVLFVDDGSTDGTRGLLRSICGQDDRYQYLALDRNRGLSTALRAGIEHCQTALVGYIDADLQTAPLDLLALLPYLPEYDLVTGIRARRQDTWLKKLSSRVANGVRRALLDDGIVDTGCPLKIMKTDVARRLPLGHGMHRFLGALVQMQGGTVRQVPVPHYPRVAGTAKYTLLNRAWKPLVDAFGVRWLRSRWRPYALAETSTAATAAPAPVRHG